MPSPAPRSLADQLRGWSDEELTALLAARPDLAFPAPQDSAQLASRASTRASVLRALDGLDRLDLTTLDAVVVLGSRTTPDQVRALVHASPGRVDAAVARLRTLALLWGNDELRAVSAVADTVATSVSGLGPPVATLLTPVGPARVADLLADVAAACGAGEEAGRSTGDRVSDVDRLAALLSDPARMSALVAGLDDAARAMLDHLERSGSEGTTDRALAPVRVSEASDPVEQLVSRALLLPRDSRHLVVPREAGLALRGGRTTREPVDAPPPLATAPRAVAVVDRAAAGAALELVHRLELLVDHWGSEPPGALRQGGLAVRDLRATAALLHGDERTAALHVELAAASLVSVGSTETQEAAWLPTDAYDAWREKSPELRWAALAQAWLAQPRLTSLVGTRVQGKGVNALSADLERPWLPDTRRAALTEVAGLPEGQVLATGTGVPSLVARVQWLRPRRPQGRDGAVAAAVEEAAVLGVLGLGGMGRHGRSLLAEGAGPAAAALRPLLPEPVDHVLLQADLTAVAPGPLREDLARDLAMVARVESRGGATVYRFTPASVRHAFDLGWSAVEVHEAIGRAARSEVPQPLRYLVDDVARTFGTVRLGMAEAFLRSDDEAALAALVHDPRAATLGLRRIAPTVVVSRSPLDVLLPRLRDLGMAPVVEGPDGQVTVSRRTVFRARAPRARGGAAAGEARSAARTAATVTAIRSGDRVSGARPAGAQSAARQSPASALALLRHASEAGDTVWIEYVDNDGSTHERVVDPDRVDGGRLRAFDHRSEEVRSYAVHRITTVRPI